MSQTKTIKPYEAYGAVSDGEIVTIGTAVQTALTGNSNYPNLPVDLATLKTDITTLSALMAEARDGSKTVIAQKKNIRSIDHGANSGQIVVRLKAVPTAVSYELQYVAESNNGAASAWTTLTLTGVRTPVMISGLTKGTTYAFQVRSLSKSGSYSDWSDSVTFVCT